MEFNQTNIASELLGCKVIHCSDEFFASAQRMLQASEAIFIPDKFDQHGKWMDGWETRRRRNSGNDYCFIKLGSKSTINNFDIDTSHFTGNYAPSIEILGCCSEANDQQIINADIDWQVLLSPQDLAGDTHNKFSCENNQPFTHLKITIYPDGGIARFRAYGNICFDQNLYQKTSTNVVALNSGAKAIYANNQHFGKLENILTEHPPINMADGWETRRRREPGNDWGIIELANLAIVDEIIIDTQFFKGNFPDSFSICAANISQPTTKALITQSMFWSELISAQKLSANQQHIFNAQQLKHQNPITHIRLNIFPDGGIARLKLNGKFIKQ